MTAEPLNYKREISQGTTIEFDEVKQTFMLKYRRTGLKFYYIELSHLAMESLIDFKRQIDLEVREWR